MFHFRSCQDSFLFLHWSRLGNRGKIITFLGHSVYKLSAKMYVKLKTLVCLLIYLPALGSQNVLTVDIWLQQCSQRAQPTNWGVHSPSSLYRPVLMPANSDRVIRSPRLAAMGVATLSGLMPTFLDAMITPIIIRPGRKRRGKICQVSVEMVELTQEMVSIPNNED